MLARKALAGTAGAPKLYVEDVFSTYLYTGTGSSQTITNNIDLSDKGGLVWIKGRSGATGHRFTDTARTATKSLESNSTAAEATESTGLTAFSGTGFTIGADADYNTNTDTYASWTFRKAEKFFDVVTYTGNGTAGRTVSHNLGSVPGCMIVKQTNGTGGWSVYHRSLPITDILELQTTGAAYTYNQWNSTAPTSTVFTLSADSQVNGNGNTYVAYLFAHDAGGFGDAGSDSIIKCGSFTCDGSGNAEVDLGWEPQWLLRKRSDGAVDWVITDNMRGWTNGGNDAFLYPNLSDAEASANRGHCTATGFTVTNQTASSVHIYIAIRRGPMKTPTSGTSVYAGTLGTSGVSQGTLVANTGFPVDLFLRSNRTSGTLVGQTVDRLRYGQLRTYNTDAEIGWSTAAGINFDSNSGLINRDTGTYDYTNNVFHNFRRAPGFFDVVCYTGTGATPQNITHNLGVAPELMIVKVRNEVRDWTVYSGNAGQYLLLDTTDAVTSNTNVWDNTAPSSTVFRVGNFGTTNSSGKNIVAYLFASVSGVSKVGSYTGNGSSQTINCNFTAGARFILIKRTDSTGDWYVYDSARGIVSGNDPQLKLNSTAAEATGYDAIDPDNSGFIVNNDATNFPINVNNATYIYLAIA